MTVQRKAQIKLYASVLIGAGILATCGGLFGRTVKLFAIFFLLMAVVVGGKYYINDRFSDLIERWRP